MKAVLALALSLSFGVVASACARPDVRLEVGLGIGDREVAASIRILDAAGSVVAEHPIAAEDVIVNVPPGAYVLVAQGRSVRPVSVPSEVNPMDRPIPPERELVLDDIPGTMLQECRMPLEIAARPIHVTVDVTRAECSMHVELER